MADDDDAAPVDRVVSSIDSPGSTATARDDEPPVAVVDVDDNNNNEPGTPLEFTPTQMGYWLCRDARLPAMRQQLAGFGGLATLVLAGPDYARFWPYVSNVWNRNASRNKLSADALRVARVEYFQCKFRREWKPKGSGLRSSVSTTVSPCLAYLKVTTEFEALDGEPTDRVERAILDFLHDHTSHDLQACDEHKINDGILRAGEETLLSHDFRKDRALKTWKADEASRALAGLCGLRKPVASQQWDNWERRARKLAKRATGTGPAS